MRLESIPTALRERLDDEAASGLVDVFNRHENQMADAIVRALVREWEPRFAAIERRLDRCATKADLAKHPTKAQMVAWMFGFSALQSAATVALLRFGL